MCNYQKLLTLTLLREGYETLSRAFQTKRYAWTRTHQGWRQVWKFPAPEVRLAVAGVVATSSPWPRQPRCSCSIEEEDLDSSDLQRYLDEAGLIIITSASSSDFRKTQLQTRLVALTARSKDVGRVAMDHSSVGQVLFFDALFEETYRRRWRSVLHATHR